VGAGDYRAAATRCRRVGQALARKSSRAELQKALDEIRELRDRHGSGNVELLREVKVLRTSRMVSTGVSRHARPEPPSQDERDR
jgi:hypothetical protein